MHPSYVKQDTTHCFSDYSPYLNSSKSNASAVEATRVTATSLNQNSAAPVSNHDNIYTFILSLPEAPHLATTYRKPCVYPTPKIISRFLHLLYHYSFLYSIRYGNKGASSPASDVHNYVIVRKLRYSISEHTSSVHTLVGGNSNVFRQEFSSLRLSVQYLTYAGSHE
jgi:hypothetical protein